MKGHNLKKSNNNWWKIGGAALVVVLLIVLAAAGIRSGGEKQPEEEPVLPLEEVIPEAEEDDGKEEVGNELPEEAEEEEEDQPEYIKALMEMGVPIPEKEVDFEDLQENVNSDIYAWVYIPGSEIDYPILQHPVDNRYYLNYNLDGSYGYPGCIYTERYNEKDFSDPLTVVYGHNMKNGTMFAGLHKYEDNEYFKENPYIYIYTPEKLFVYEIFVSHEYGSEHLLYQKDYTNEEQFNRYIEKIMGVRGMNCNRAEDVEVTGNSRILVLSTCMADKPDNRYLVQGVLLNEE